MNEPPEPGTPDAQRIVAAYRDQTCTSRWDGKPSTFCYGKANRPRLGGDIADIYVFDGSVEAV